MVRHGAINVSFDYLMTDGYEENLLGLNILGPAVKYDDNGEAYNLNVQDSGTIYNNLKENKSLFFVVGDEGHDLTAYDKKELGLGARMSWVLVTGTYQAIHSLLLLGT